MKPRKNYRSRPKKTGAKKKQKISAQKRRLTGMGHKEESLAKLNVVELRSLLKRSAKKKAVKKTDKPKKAKTPSKKAA
ncbi:MAG: hypothetical protein ABIG55_06160 [Candidatus Omnitrophota bacterium]